MKYLSLTTASLTILWLGACRAEQKPAADSVNYDRMFEELSGTYARYTDSARNVTDADSASLARMDELTVALTHDLDKVYSAYPANADDRLTQEQQDTLWQCVERFSAAANRAKLRVAHTHDTVSADTVP